MEKIGIKQATAKGYIECSVSGGADFSYPTSKLRRGRVQGAYMSYHNDNNEYMQNNRMEKQIIVIGSLNPEKKVQDRVRILHRGGGVTVFKSNRL